MSCSTCDDFLGNVRIDGSSMLDEIIAAVAPAVCDAKFIIDSGDLQWRDYVKCDLHCANCGQNFELSAETYHGSGGRWSVV